MLEYLPKGCLSITMADHEELKIVGSELQTLSIWCQIGIWSIVDFEDDE